MNDSLECALSVHGDTMVERGSDASRAAGGSADSVDGRLVWSHDCVPASPSHST
ncbi:MAG: hypothetical protein GF331_10405, partial [Chitinivibrionales bacterium]|nr:hypothetical protein [Chitinivibrionales bacterium]